MPQKYVYNQFLPLIPIGMGAIQHEWIDLYDVAPCPPTATFPIPPCPEPNTIKINFCSRYTK